MSESSGGRHPNSGSQCAFAKTNCSGEAVVRQVESDAKRKEVPFKVELVYVPFVSFVLRIELRKYFLSAKTLS